jgi:hypothetical protein|tara:strand:- start:615 stop:914 length:300 start_codon:yes stop_codon:yes gene_type:complete
MSGRRLVLPQFPTAPMAYDPKYMAEVVRSFSVFLELFNNPGDARHTELTLTNLQQNDYNLETGALFQQDGVLKIVIANKPHPAGLSGTGTVGSVTVSTP